MSDLIVGHRTAAPASRQGPETGRAEQLEQRKQKKSRTVELVDRVIDSIVRLSRAQNVRELALIIRRRWEVNVLCEKHKR